MPRPAISTSRNPHSPRSDVAARPLILSVMTLALLAISGCAFERDQSAPTAPAAATGPGVTAIVIGPGGDHDPVVPELIPPSQEQAVVNLADGVLAHDVAVEYGITVAQELPAADGGTLVLFDLPAGFDLNELREADGIDAADTNTQVNLAEVQTLVIGFFEGHWSEDTMTGQSAFESLELPAVHAGSIGKHVLIAVLDTGADFTHPHLENNLVALPDGVGLSSYEDPNGLDDDGDGEIDEAYGHGTLVCGAVVTVAPGADVLPIRVLNSDGIGSLWDIVRGMEIACEAGVDVINLSLTLSESAEAMDQALAHCSQKEIVVTAAAGNYGNNDPRYPATSPLAVGVAAVDARDELASFSGSGNEISLAAPGVSVLSSFPGGELWYATGTSMAAPIAAGSIAVVMKGLDISAKDALRGLGGTSVPISPRLSVVAGRVAPVALVGGDLVGLLQSTVRETWDVSEGR